MYPSGEFVHGEFSSADATTAAVVTLFDANQAGRSLKAGERLVIDSYVINVAAAITVTLFSDKNNDSNVANGEVIARGSFDANGGLAESSIEHPCAISTAANLNAPKVKASGAGQVYVTLRGRIVNS